MALLFFFHHLFRLQLQNPAQGRKAFPNLMRSPNGQLVKGFDGLFLIAPHQQYAQSEAMHKLKMPEVLRNLPPKFLHSKSGRGYVCVMEKNDGPISELWA